VSGLLLYVVVTALPRIVESVNNNAVSVSKAAEATQQNTQALDRTATLSATQHAQIIDKDQETIRALIETNTKLSDKVSELGDRRR
jgi:hypothetical protein